jgi:hypothetical protein
MEVISLSGNKIIAMNHINQKINVGIEARPKILSVDSPLVDFSKLQLMRHLIFILLIHLVMYWLHAFSKIPQSSLNQPDSVFCESNATRDFHAQIVYLC